VNAPKPPLARALDLLADGLAADADLSNGYVDLLGAAPQAGPTTGIAQRLMRNPLLATIYERQWRPVLGRFFKGMTGPSMAGEHAFAAETLALTPGSVALDVACGTGAFTRTFAREVGPEGLAIGLDASRPMLGQALAATDIEDPIAYVRADAVRPPFQDAVVDGLCCFAALHLFAYPEDALASFARLLKPGGRLALLTTARQAWAPFNRLDSVGGLVSGVRIFEREEITGLLEDLSFVDIEVRYSGFAQFVSARRPYK